MGKKLARHLHVGLISGTSTLRHSCGIWVTKIRTWIHGWPLGIIKALSIIFNGRKITNEQVKVFQSPIIFYRQNKLRRISLQKKLHVLCTLLLVGPHPKHFI